MLGRSKTKHYTIDSVEETLNGFCVTGWYYKEDIKKVSILDPNQNPIELKLTSISRDDVFASTGKPAQGFEIYFKAESDLTTYLIEFSLIDGTTFSEPLVLNEASTETVSTKPIKSTAPESAGIEASCEYVIETATHYYVTGWIFTNLTELNFVLCDHQGKSVATLLGQMKLHRRDVYDAYNQDARAKNCGVNLFFEKKLNVSTSPTWLTFEIDNNAIELPIIERFGANDNKMANARRLLEYWNPQSPSHFNTAPYFSGFLKSLYSAEQPPKVNRTSFNELGTIPEVSIVIPLYGRYDFMRYQLSHF